MSQGGGTEPLWGPDGRTLYYRDTTGTRLFATPVAAGVELQFGPATVTRGHWMKPGRTRRLYDVTPNGGALLIVAAPTSGRELRVVLNFDEVIQRKLAGTK